LLNCEVVALHDYLNHPSALQKINEFLKDKKLRTTYLNRNMEKDELTYGGFSNKSPMVQQAYEGFLGLFVI
jgi:hypothetical protein